MASVFQSPAGPVKTASGSFHSNDEEESFVILCKSIDPSFESIKYEIEVDDSKASNVVEEGKKLVNSLLDAQMEVSTQLPPLPSVGNGQESQDQVDQTISISTVSSEFFPEDLQTKINEVIDENTKLKNTILENNTSMKSQRDRILAWQQEVQKVFEANKQQFKDAKACIEHHKNELAKLTKELEASKQSGSFKQEKELEEAKNLIQNLTEKYEGLSIEQDKKQNNVPESEETLLEIKNLKVENEKLQNELALLKESNAKLRPNEKELVEAMTTIAELTNKNVELTDAMKKISTDFNKELSSKSAAYNILELEIDVAKRKIAELSQENKDNFKRDDEIKGVVEKFEQEINNLTGKLDSSTKYVEQLKIENKTLHHLTAATNEQLVSVQQQLMGAQMSNGELNREKHLLGEQINIKDKQISELKEQLQSMVEDKENVFQVQLDLYKTDFEAERSAKDTLMSENKRISEDLMNLQRRNQQLQEEVELLRDPDWVAPTTRHSSRTSLPRSGHSDSPPIQTYTCPICNSKFRSVRQVEDHVENCPQLTP